MSTSGGGDNRDAVARATEVKRSAAGRLRGYPHVAGVGVGLKEVGGVRTARVAIRVYVDRKVPRAQLADDEVLPGEVEGVPVDVVEARFEAHGDPAEDPAETPGEIDDHRARHDPLVGGVSIGNDLLGGSGTLGGLVFDARTGRDLLLSNWHVLCGRPTCGVGEPIIQPGRGGDDGGTSADIVARLHRSALTDEVDGAVAVLSGHRVLRQELLNLGPYAGVAEAVLGSTVRKSGRTTGVTAGVIADISAEVDVLGYPQGTVRFQNQIVIQDGNPSAPGDSGSLWIDAYRRVVALNFAGSAGRALANPIAAVAAALDIEFDRGVTVRDRLAATTSRPS